MDAVIQVQNLSKIYGTYLSRARVTSLRNITFKIKGGERVCFFGPNGAGKSTIMKAIMGLIKPTKGRVLVNNYNVQRSKLITKKLMGYLPSELNFFLDVPCKESLYHFGLLRGLKKREAKVETEQLLESVGLAKWWDLPPGLMSSGMKQRFSLALAIIGDPEIILFDEPTAFIDVQGKMKIYQLIHDYVADMKKTVLMSSHNIQDALVMSDRLLLIDRGQLILDGPIVDIINEKCQSMEIILTDATLDNEDLRKIFGTDEFELTGRKILRTPEALQQGTYLVNKLQENRIPVFSFRPFLEQQRKNGEKSEG